MKRETSQIHEHEFRKNAQVVHFNAMHDPVRFGNVTNVNYRKIKIVIILIKYSKWKFYSEILLKYESDNWLVSSVYKFL